MYRSANIDLIWRQSFVKRVLRKLSLDEIEIPKQIYREMMTTDQVADYLNCSKKTIQNKTSNGEIPAIKGVVGVRYSKKDIDKYIEEHKKIPKKKKYN